MALSSNSDLREDSGVLLDWIDSGEVEAVQIDLEVVVVDFCSLEAVEGLVDHSYLTRSEMEGLQLRISVG